jgi:hypothetical protein
LTLVATAVSAREEKKTGLDSLMDDIKNPKQWIREKTKKKKA